MKAIKIKPNFRFFGAMLILVTTTGCQAQPYVTPQSPITLTSTIVQTNMVSTTVTLPVSTITTTINSVQIQPGSVQVTAQQLYLDYATNTSGSDAKYKNKTVVINGVIGSVNTGTTASIGFVTTHYISGSTETTRVGCNFASASSISGLIKGQTVTVQGYCTGIFFGNVFLDNGNIVSR